MDLLFRPNTVALTLLIPGLISAALAIYAFNIRNVSGSRVFGFVNIAVAISSLAYGAELASLNLESMMLATLFEYLGIVVIPVLWLILALLYTGRRNWVNKRNLILLFIVPFITLVLVSTSQFQPFFYSSINLDTSGLFPQLSVTRGIWYWVNSGYTCIAILLSSGLLLEKLRHPNPAFRPQIIALLIGTAVPSIVYFLYLAFGLVIAGNVMVTPFAFALSGLVITWGIFRHRLFNLIPIARDYIIDSMKDGVIVVDSENRLGDTNKASRQIFGWDDSALGLPVENVLRDWPEILDQCRSKNYSRKEISHGKLYSRRYYEVTTSPLSDRRSQPLGRLTIVRDITEWKNLEKKLEQIATHDSLTGLPGRVLLVDRVNMAINRAKRKHARFAIMMLDLDHFKAINDTLGHKVGDEVLKTVSGKLKDTLRKNDTVARLGGDEFVILLPETSEAGEVESAAARILDSFHNPICVDFHTLQISLSLGIAFFPEDGGNFTDLLKQADTAMYKAKAKGRNRYEFFEASNVIV